MKKIYHLPFTIYQNGFTLIELMVVLSITAVLGTLGIAGFMTYNQTQVLQSSASEVVTMLNLAKSRAQSQIKPSALCSSGTLDGYSVSVRIVQDRSYALWLKCSGLDVKINEQDKNLPSGLRFTSSIIFFFPVQTGGVQALGEFDISSSDGKKKTIKVNSLGGVSVQ